jgi:hypothetical protein
MGIGSFLGVESGWGVTTPHPLLVPRSKNRVELYVYSPEGPSWPVKRVKPTTKFWLNKNNQNNKPNYRTHKSNTKPKLFAIG